MPSAGTPLSPYCESAKCKAVGARGFHLLLGYIPAQREELAEPSDEVVLKSGRSDLIRRHNGVGDELGIRLLLWWEARARINFARSNAEAGLFILARLYSGWYFSKRLGEGQGRV
jgi:hypothetical protein